MRASSPTARGTHAECCADACVAGESPPDICWARARWCRRRCSRQMRVAARIADACDLQMQLPPMAHGARAAAAAPPHGAPDALSPHNLRRRNRPRAGSRRQAHPPATNLLGHRGSTAHRAVRCRAPLIHGTHATVQGGSGRQPNIAHVRLVLENHEHCRRRL